MICFVVSVLEGAVCLQIYHCTEPKRPHAWLLNTKVPMNKNNLNIKNRNMFTRGLRVKLKKAFHVTHQLVDNSVSSQHLEPLHAVQA